jgi:AraC-like DNA-binding protein
MPAAYFLLVLREFGGSGARAAELLRGTGLDERDLSELDEITLGQQLAQVRNLARRERPGWALGVGSGFGASTHGALGFACISAPTLGESLSVLARFEPVRAPFYRLVADESSEDTYRLYIEESLPLEEELRIPLLEMVMLSNQALVESVIGRPMREGCFEFAYPEPSYTDRYPEFFHAPLRFDRPETAITIPSSWLGSACPLADAGMYQASLRKLEIQLRRLGSRDFVVAHVEEVLASGDDAGIGLDETARRLHLSRRTLARRLAQAGTSFREILEAHHKERAEALLRDDSLDVAEVGWRLGYNDAANFGRACRRWFGMSPGSYREQLRRRS